MLAVDIDAHMLRRLVNLDKDIRLRRQRRARKPN
jgi:hypothetical protein